MTRWRRLFGDPSRFAVEIAFLDDPDPGSVPPELEASWGSLAIWVEGRPLCAFRQGGESRNVVHWYLLPFFEWLLEHWVPLFHQERTPFPSSTDDVWGELERVDEARDLNTDSDLNDFARWQRWLATHSLRSASRGGLFPDVLIRRYLGEIEISWGERPAAGQPADLRFLERRGVARFKPEHVTEPLEQCLRDSLSYLGEIREQRWGKGAGEIV